VSYQVWVNAQECGPALSYPHFGHVADVFEETI